MDVFKKRRALLFEKVKKPIVLRTTPIFDRNDGGGSYPYRADSNFFYLTGFDQPGAVALLFKKRMILFAKKNDQFHEVWVGRLPSFAEIQKRTGAAKVIDIADLEKMLQHYLRNEKDVFVNAIVNHPLDRISKRLRTALRRKKKKRIERVIAGLRLKKDISEIRALQEAVRVTRNAFLEILKEIKPGMKESEVEAILLYNYRKNQACPAYEVIAASGKNALVLHYTKNASALKRGDLLLLDSGAEVKNYAADVTRTFPVSGTFSKAQKEVYEVVLRANKEAIKVVSAGISIKDVHQKAVEVLVGGLLALGLLTGDKKEIIKKKTYRRFFMHGTSHWLGLDVHDCAYSKEEILEEGMILTVEPGLYIPDAKDIPRKYRGIGVRIEDDVLVIKSGRKVLTAKIPKEIRDIEDGIN